MDCNELIEMLDAYALGACDPEEAKEIEAHVAECVRCWEELSTARQTAALIALSVNIEPAPAHLEHRIMNQAERERGPILVREPRVSIWERLRVPWRATAGAFGVASVAALAVSGVLAMQMQDLRSDNDTLESQLQATTFDLQERVQLADTQIANQQSAQQTILTVLSDSDREEAAAEAWTRGKQAKAYYTWSPGNGRGFMVCEDLPPLDAGQVFQIWLVADGDVYAMRPFLSTDGTCQVTMETGMLGVTPTGIGLTIEDNAGAPKYPSDGFVLYAHFPEPTPEPAATAAAQP